MSGSGNVIDMKNYRGADLVNSTDWAMNSTGLIGDNDIVDAPYATILSNEYRD
jgi:hypothetical protein